MMPNFSFHVSIFGENLEEWRTVEKHFVSVLLGRKQDFNKYSVLWSAEN